MNLTASLPAGVRRALALATVISTFLPLARATPAPPPDFPFTERVREGCYIAALVYVTKFAGEFPAEFATPISVHPRPYPKPHTIALLTWRGEWWLRDEFLGLIKLGLAAGSREVTAAVERRAESALQRRALSLSATARARIASFGLQAAGPIKAEREVATAAKLLPLPTERYIILSRGCEVPVLLFRPSPGRIAVYDPHFGTALGVTGALDGAKVVKAVAARLGYPVASVRRAVTLPAGATYAMAAANGGSAR